MRSYGALAPAPGAPPLKTAGGGTVRALAPLLFSASLRAGNWVEMRRLNFPSISPSSERSAAMFSRWGSEGTRLDSRHLVISYYRFCLEKKRDQRDRESA